MSTAPECPHRDDADWQVIVLALRSECMSWSLISHLTGISRASLARMAAGETTTPISRHRWPLIRIAHEELARDDLAGCRIADRWTQRRAAWKEAGADDPQGSVAEHWVKRRDG